MSEPEFETNPRYLTAGGMHEFLRLFLDEANEGQEPFFQEIIAWVNDFTDMDLATDSERILADKHGRRLVSVMQLPGIGVSVAFEDPRSPSGFTSIVVQCGVCLLLKRPRPEPSPEPWN